jgi:hypothetical protein
MVSTQPVLWIRTIGFQRFNAAPDPDPPF